MESKFTHINSKVLDGANVLSESEVCFLKKQIKKINDKLNKYELQKYYCGRLLDYDNLKKSGFSVDKISIFEEEDTKLINDAKERIKINTYKRNCMFGYPANLENDSYAVKYLKYLETKMFFQNNCGDPYQRGNYAMDCKDVEVEIVNEVAKNLGLINQSYWGYVTTGGTEGNFWGIMNAIKNIRMQKFIYLESAITVYLNF